jgi:ABC-type multidrug transport system ATPase subunit
MSGRTVILVSHHVQLCTPGADFVVALDNGRVIFQGDRDTFRSSGVMNGLVQSTAEVDTTDDKPDATSVPVLELSLDSIVHSEPTSQTSSIPGTPVSDVKHEKKPPRKLMDDEKRAVGRISRDVWEIYIKACGNKWYWAIFGFALFLGAFCPVIEYGWIK